MGRTQKRDVKSERINLCLRRTDRLKLEEIAQLEDRDLGYLCSWFVEWGMEQYQNSGLSLTQLRSTKLVREKLRAKHAEQRLTLRVEAQRSNEELSGSSPERKRA